MAASAGSPPASWRAWRPSTIPAYGYGIRYDHGLFRQEINDGWQVELPETGSTHGNPWEFERREATYEIGFGGTVECRTDRDGAAERHVWQPAGAGARRRLRHAGRRLARQAGEHAAAVERASRSTRSCLDAFNAGDHIGALAESNRADAHHPRALSRRLARRPGRSCGCGRSISSPPPRCRTSCAAICSSTATSQTLPDKVAIQLNDTHPAIAVAELMRLLVDVHEHRLGRGLEASPSGTFAYTNHTLLPEALESWPVPLFERLLPRHMQIIYAINAACCSKARATRRSMTTPDRRDLADRRERRAGACAWATSPSSARTRSTASRRCTPS